MSAGPGTRHSRTLVNDGEKQHWAKFILQVWGRRHTWGLIWHPLEAGVDPDFHDHHGLGAILSEVLS